MDYYTCTNTQKVLGERSILFVTVTIISIYINFKEKGGEK